MSHKININGENKVVAHDAEDTVLLAALREGLGFPYECNAGACGSCKFELLCGQVESLCENPPGLTARDVRKNVHLGCQTRPITDISIKARLSNEYEPLLKTQRVKARFLNSYDITHDIKEFVFITDQPAHFQPGQYALLSFPNLGIKRAYSMSNLPNVKGEWRFQIRKVINGKGTEFLFNQVTQEDVIEIDAPYGMAYVRDNERDIVCVAGGSGLAPMVSIARGASDQGLLKNKRLHFFYGGRSYKDVVVESQISDLPEFGKKIFFHPVVSDMTEENIQKWSGEFGFVHESVEKKLGECIKDYEFYFAGPPPMTKSLQETLMLKHQVPFNQIHFDRFF
ncbi:2Fe-2S iron-sulfur cluster binding domain-containing protein [Polynucleobacter sp. 30F-ANTBAC]|uniref:2Fe-2S iron-sulfur cluster-binding protein n=1 Tax=Polynucleobacter sp. 30F-ANTBAC TaxID=2689095 RepID=UPI001C0E6FD1|nr:2Fe-2S iron-sulfur cluster-binding protein [Polynucleobacter sp. 30F-ANTBAC]MBU3600628.1 2Fe-2S iron-sulfur cluster binding domain-containing protein [Polynucleobacter sp. 30F-ANTBAC]